jgi:hypothetical protein
MTIPLAILQWKAAFEMENSQCKHAAHGSLTKHHAQHCTRGKPAHKKYLSAYLISANRMD